MSLVRYRKMNSTLGKTMEVIICCLRVYLWQFSRFWLQLLSKQIMIIWNATKNDINFIHEMRMHDETSNWFTTGKTTVLSKKVNGSDRGTKKNTRGMPGTDIYLISDRIRYIMYLLIHVWNKYNLSQSKSTLRPFRSLVFTKGETIRWNKPRCNLNVFIYID